MKIQEQTVVLRILKPNEGMKIKSLVTEEVFEDEVYLGKEDSIENYIEVVDNELEKGES